MKTIRFSTAVLSLVASLGLVALPIPASAVTCSGGTDFTSTGDGTNSDPYEISTAADLIYLSSTQGALLSGHFTQTANIDLQGCDFTPIGSTASAFSGNYNGNGKVIAGLVLTQGANGTGLFGALSGSVHQLGLEDVSSTGSSNLVGALAGRLSGGTISQSYATGTISANELVGGLVGEVTTGGIFDSWADVDLTATDRVGGLVGGRSSGSLLRNYSMGSISSTGFFSGGLLGAQQLAMAAANDSYYNTTTSGMSTSAFGVGLNSENFRVRANFEGWDFDAPVWKISGSANNGFPYLAWQNIVPTVASTQGTDFWLTFDLNSNASSVGWKYLYISSPVDTTATVTLPNASQITVNVIAGVTSSVDLEPQASVLENAADEGIAANAIRVTSIDPVSVYTVHTKNHTSDGSSILPTSSLGYDYVAVAPYQNQLDYLGDVARQRLTVIATEPGTTTVSITPKVAFATSVSGTNHAAGTPYSVTLTQGQVYTVVNAVRTTDFSGTKITSDRKISVQTSAYFSGYDTVSGAADHTYEQMVPTSAWGQTFYAARGGYYSQVTNRDVFIVAAKDDNTEVSLNGSAVATLASGSIYKFSISTAGMGVDTVTANKPVFMVQVSTGSTRYYKDATQNASGATATFVSGDPAFSTVPPVTQYLNSYVISAPATGFTVNIATVVAKTSEKHLVTLGGYAIGAEKFTDIPNSNYSRAWVPIPLGTSYFRAPSGFLLAVGGYNDHDSYTYSGGFGLVDPVAYPNGVPELESLQTPTAPVSVGGDSISGTPNVCSTLTVSEGAWLDGRSAITATEYQWMRNGLPISGGTSSTLDLAGFEVGDLISYQIKKTNALGTTTAFSTPISVVNNLPSLISTNVGTLSPAFDPCVTSYSVNVIQDWLAVTVGVSAGATISMNGNSLLSDQASSAQSLSIGANTRTISVTKGGYSQTYTLNINYSTGPVISIQPVTSLLDTSATVNAKVNANGNSITSAFFEYDTNSDFSTSSSVTPSFTAATTEQTISSSLTGLIGAQRYYLRMSVTNSVGTVVSQVFEFTTKAAPILYNISVSRSTSVETDLNLSASVNANGSATQLIVTYSLNSDMSSATDLNLGAVVTGTSAASRSGVITGLPKGAKVYYQLRVENQYGANYGPLSSYQLKAIAEFGVPTFNPGSTTARVEFPVNPHSAPTDLICIGVSLSANVSAGCSTATHATPMILDGNEYQSAAIDLTGLNPNTNYYVKALARNKPISSDVVSYSGVYSFTTTAAPQLTSSLEGPRAVGPSDSILLTFAFSEAITGFDKLDVVLSGDTTGWTAQPVYEVSPGLYIMEIRPTGAVASPSTLTISAPTPGTNSSGTAFPAVTAIDVAVVGAAPNISYASSPLSLGQYQAMTAASVTNSGGIAATFTVSPSLPSGLSIDNQGTISGTPLAAQAATTYTVTASNAVGSSTTSISIAISASGLQPPSIDYPGASYNLERGATISPIAPTLGGGSVSTIAISPALPLGLSLNTSTGVISGTPLTFATAKNYSVTASNPAGSDSFTIRIATFEVAPDFSYSASSFELDQFAAITPIVPISTGGAGYFYVASGTLPTGLTLDSETGVISGTPAGTRLANDQANATSVTVRLVNSAGFSDFALSLRVLAVVPIVTYVDRTVTVGSYFSSNPTVSATGGAVTTYAISPSLPTGVIINATTGIISGTPTAIPLSPNFTITTTNGAGSSTASWSLTVSNRTPQFSYSTTSYTANELQVFTTVTPTVTYGVGNSYTISPALPAGLSIDSATGIVSGTPSAGTAQNSTTYTVTGTNSAGTYTRTITLRITNLPVMVFSYPSSSVVVTEAAVLAPQLPVASVGTPTSFSISPALPQGLAIDPATGAISGSPVRGARQSATGYLVTGTDGTSTNSFALSIQIDSRPIQFSYANPTLLLEVGSAMSLMQPTAASGSVLPLTYSISPALPTGLAIDPTTGAITGTPAAGMEQTATTYTITGEDGLLTEVTTVSIEIQAQQVVIPGGLNGESNYFGPVIEALSVKIAYAGQSLAAFGLRLSSIDFLLIGGIRVEVQDLSDSRFAFNLPSALKPGRYDIVIFSDHGQLTVQEILEIRANGPAFWTKRSDTRVKLYAKNIATAGKVQFWINGKEFAWIRAASIDDPKLSISSVDHYFVRTKALASGKNRFEITVDGKRVWFATYALR